ncbi:MAG: hypothetical protein JW715_09585 [Sedimentisphaerales bacterium]|nr:hypothetical protein [Sedimentisphaerales bacterium]
MKKYLITSVITIMLFGANGLVHAEEPYVRITTTPSSFGLGTFAFWEDGVSEKTLTIKVESNCVHGPIVASITPLKGLGRGFISPDRISVKTPTTEGFVSMARPVAISETTNGSHEIPMNFKIKPTIMDNAGRYSGTLVLTLMPPS